MCDPVTAAVVGGGAMLGGTVLKGQAQGKAYQNAANANAQALAHQLAYQQQINDRINQYLGGLNIAGQIGDNRTASRQTLAQAMARAAPQLALTAGTNYRARLAADNRSRNGKIADALASMEAWRAYGSGEAIKRAKLAQRIGTLANFAGGQAGADKLATRAAAIPNQDAMAAGQLMTDLGSAAMKLPLGG